jgi:hypothetical protein
MTAWMPLRIFYLIHCCVTRSEKRCANALILNAPCRASLWTGLDHVTLLLFVTGLQQAEDLFTNLPETGLPSDINTARTALSGHGELVALLDDALIAEPPLLARDGGFIAEGYDAELDEARKLKQRGPKRDRLDAGRFC